MKELKVILFAFLSLLMVVCIVLNLAKVIAGTATCITGFALVICIFALVCDLAVIWLEIKG
jgi:hypothetical protein